MTIRCEYTKPKYTKFLSVFIPFGGIRIRVIIGHKKPVLECFANRVFAVIYRLLMEPLPHKNELVACTSTLDPPGV